MTTYRTRYAPSPTGASIHVGGARTALFSYLLARRSGGQFVLRIEDTDRRRHQEQAIQMIIDDLRWLGLEWDEGVDVGGPHAPYRQSERLELYTQAARRLLEQGKAYYAFDTEDELEAAREAAEARKAAFRYSRPPRFPDEADVARARAEGRPVVARFACPQRDVMIHDDAFGEVTVPATEMEDFVILKADGFPTFYLANVVDDAEMQMNYVVRGQEFLGQTWRQVLLREALGYQEPRYCHLPLVLDMQGRKLSKRDGDVEVGAFRKAGYLPEAMLNFIALLGWSPGGDREKMTLAEMVELFGVERIGKVNAKFDRDKLLAFNTDAIAAATTDRLVAALRDYLSLNDTPIPGYDEALLRRLVEANRGMRTLADVVRRSGVLFVGDEAFEYDSQAVQKVLAKGEGQGFDVLARLRGLLAEVRWTHEDLTALLDGFCREHHLAMGKVAQPIRVAVTGGTISPAIHDTLEILGRDKTLARIDRCLRLRDPVGREKGP